MMKEATSHFTVLLPLFFLYLIQSYDKFITILDKAFTFFYNINNCDANRHEKTKKEDNYASFT